MTCLVRLVFTYVLYASTLGSSAMDNVMAANVIAPPDIAIEHEPYVGSFETPVGCAFLIGGDFEV